MNSKMITTIISAIIIVFIRTFAYRAIRSKRDDVAVRKQKLPTAIGISKIVFTVVTVLMGIFFILAIFGSLDTGFSENKEMLIVTGIIFAFFVGLNILIFRSTKGNSYEEQHDRFTVTTRDNPVTIRYSEIVDWSVGKDSIFIKTIDKKVRVNTLWYRPTKLIENLIILHNQNRFEYKNEKVKNRRLNLLNNLLEESDRP